MGHALMSEAPADPIVAPSSRCFSNSTTTEDSISSTATIQWPLTTLNLGLLPTLCPPNILASITQLPEVREAVSSPETCSVNNQSAAVTAEGFHRAVDIFRQMQEGGPEHVALLALLAEFHQRRGEFTQALETVSSLQQYASALTKTGSAPSSSHDLSLARAKITWLQGDTDTCQAACQEIIDHPQNHQSPLHFAAARNGQALARLLAAETLDEAFSLRDSSRMVLRLLEQSTPQHRLPWILAQLNYGTTEFLYADMISRINDVDAPIDGAMRAWMEALTSIEIFQREKKRSPPSDLLRTIEARVWANLATGALTMGRLTGQDQTPKASEYSGKALKLLEQTMQSPTPSHALQHEDLGHVLSLVATCYHKNGSAVTAEGLLQSAMDVTAVGPTQQLLHRSSMMAYASLLQDWEKREEQGRKLQAQAQELEMPELWKTKISGFGTLWFWTPNDFVS